MSMHGVLGESTSYPRCYEPELLYPIARCAGRETIDYPADKLAVGVDWWHAFEVSWLTTQGVSQVAMARFTIPANSSHIVESKSLKLYLNGLNFTQFASWQAVQDTISKDLSACVGADVAVTLFALDGGGGVKDNSLLTLIQPLGVCIDNALSAVNGPVALADKPDARLLKVARSADNGNYHIHCHLLRSNCPVTNQPDWGTLAVRMTGERLPDDASMLAYVLSYRQHNGFHEQCVEQIFADLSRCFVPDSLMVRAWYTRRGGIDINPCRVSDRQLLPLPSRLVRQ